MAESFGAEQLHDASRGASRTARWLTGWPMVAALLAIHFALAFTSLMNKCCTYDEIPHLTGGCSYWLQNDYRLFPQTGNLPQRWCAIPLLAGAYSFPAERPQYWTVSSVFHVGYEFSYLMGNDIRAMLMKGRAFAALLSVALAAIVYFWSRRLFGPVGGIISLSLCVFNPTMLANGGLITSDMAATLFFIASLWSLSILVDKVTPATVLVSALAMAGLFLSKMTAALIVPVAAVLVGLHLFSKASTPAGVFRLIEVKTIWRRAAVFAGVGLIHAVIIVAVIWAFYGFRYSAFRTPNPSDAFYPPLDKLPYMQGAIPGAIQFLNSRRLLPEAYLYGFAHVYSTSHFYAVPAFLNGEYSPTGWRSFFPYTFLVKTPLSVFFIAILALAAAFRKTRITLHEAGAALRTVLAPALYHAAPLWVFLAAYWATAISSHLNVGHRHIMPTYPPLFILSGAAAYWVTARKRLAGAAVIAALVIGAAECALAWPDYIPYFNAFAGGSKNGYRHLVDSSLDWGQDLPGLEQWLAVDHSDEAESAPVYLAYFGMGNPRYERIHARQLPGAGGGPGPDPFSITPITGGMYCISATVLQQVYSTAPGHWQARYERAYQRTLLEFDRYMKAKENPVALQTLMSVEGENYWEAALRNFDTLRIARLCAFLRQREPDDEVHDSILIYRLTDEDARKAVRGPPPELIEPDSAGRP